MTTPHKYVRTEDAPLLPPPTDTLAAPPAPDVAAPDPIDTEPVEPELDVPELNFSRPDAPVAPALADAIVTAPLVLAMPWPLVTPIAPPVCTVLRPKACSKRRRTRSCRCPR